MMEEHEFCDSCPGCRPALLDVTTEQRLADDNPIMIAVNKIWDEETTYEQRKAFIEFTLHNSRVPIIVARAEEVIKKFETVLSP